MSDNETAVVEVTELVKTFKQRGKRGVVRSVAGVSFRLNRGEVLGIIGESGCGKSTLAKMLVKLEEPDAGTIRYAGRSMQEWFRDDPLEFRRFAQIVFQNPFDTFDPRYSIGKILTDTMRLHRIGQNSEERRLLAADRLEQVGLAPGKHFLDRYPHELSGGQLQRISILRTMLLDPRFLVADEPVSMLDASIQADILNLLADQCRKHDTSMMFISHDIGTVRYLADQIAVMYLGRFVEYGDADEVLERPRHPYTRALIASSLQLDAKADPEAVQADIRLAGEAVQPTESFSGCSFYPRCAYRTDACKHEQPELAEAGENHQVRCLHPLNYLE